MKVFAAENRPPAAIGLMRYGTINIPAHVTGDKSGGDYRRHVTDRGQIVGGYAVRAYVRCAEIGTPSIVRPARGTMRAADAFKLMRKIFHQKLATIDAEPSLPPR